MIKGPSGRQMGHLTWERCRQVVSKKNVEAIEICNLLERSYPSYNNSISTFSSEDSLDLDYIYNNIQLCIIRGDEHHACRSPLALDRFVQLLLKWMEGNWFQSDLFLRSIPPLSSVL